MAKIVAVPQDRGERPARSPSAEEKGRGLQSVRGKGGAPEGAMALEKTQGVAPVQFSQGRQDLSIFAERTRDFCNLGPGSIGQPHKANESASVAGMVAAANALRGLIEAI